MATVYLAQKIGPGGVCQPAAIKVIHPHLARDNDFVDMFLDEARIVSCINHPNVSRVLDFGHAEGTYYLAMEYVMGETWGDTLSALKATPDARGILPALLSQVLAQASEGLHAAHEACDEDVRPLLIVHRDVSPQNIIVGYDGSVRVLDFGIASAAEKLHTTRNGTIKGRFAYMAPEQMRGHLVDRRADIWSLGVMLWEGLARERLFKRDTEAETVLAVTADPLPSLEGREPPVPARLNKVVLQALSREREARFATARAFGIELSNFSSGGPAQVGMPEVSVWMQRLFKERIVQKSALLRSSARTVNRESALSTAPHSLERQSTPPQANQDRGVETIPTNIAPATLPSISVVREVQKKQASFRGAALCLAAALVAISAAVWLRSVDLARAPHGSPPIVQIAAARPELARPDSAREKPSEQIPARPTPEKTARQAPEKKHDVQDTVNTPPARDELPAPELTQQATEQREQAAARRHSARAAKRVKDEAAVEMVSVNIVTPGGWADVYLKGVWLGTTPARIELPAGRHVLVFRPFGDGEELVRKIELTKDTPLKLKVAVD
jgi:serine/threonine-protein kinase